MEITAEDILRIYENKGYIVLSVYINGTKVRVELLNKIVEFTLGDYSEYSLKKAD